jgi:hypothetical protein
LTSPSRGCRKISIQYKYLSIRFPLPWWEGIKGRGIFSLSFKVFLAIEPFNY